MKYLAAVEYRWFCRTFGRETEPLPFDDNDPDADLRIAPDESTADILAFDARAQAASDSVIEEHGHPPLGPHPHDRGDSPPRRARRHRT
ncbi:hypothetical protein GCM10010399_75880 [Dactylosporangium fulvum]